MQLLCYCSSGKFLFATTAAGTIGSCIVATPTQVLPIYLPTSIDRWSCFDSCCIYDKARHMNK